MTQPIQSIRGMHDIMPPESHRWLWLESTLKNLAFNYGYEPIRTPILEPTALFQRSLGQVTDVVSKEMYTFEDRNDLLLSLRPEGTASCVRAGIQQGLFHNQTQSLWYLGPMFRRERPQKGRLRQFHQFGIELLGYTSVMADVELIAFIHDLWKQLGLTQITLEINTLGHQADRHRYRSALVDYLTPHQAHFSEDESDRLARNPLRLLDTKSKILRDILDGAPKMSAYLSDESIDRHTLFKDQLHTLGIPYVENEHLVRGLDYYNDTVFEWTTECLGAQGTLCAGGRYDTLVAQLGGSPTPAIGCALGLERVLELLESEPIATEPSLIVLSESKAQPYVQSVARTIRSRYPQFRIGVDLKEGALKKQFKRAQQQQYTWALILETETHYRFKCLKTDITPIDGTLDTLNQQLDTLIFGT